MDIMVAWSIMGNQMGENMFLCFVNSTCRHIQMRRATFAMSKICDACFNQLPNASPPLLS